MVETWTVGSTEDVATRVFDGPTEITTGSLYYTFAIANSSPRQYLQADGSSFGSTAHQFFAPFGVEGFTYTLLVPATMAGQTIEIIGVHSDLGEILAAQVVVSPTITPPLAGSPFAMMNRDVTLTLVRNTAAAGYYDANDVWVPNTGAPETILGHISVVRVQSRESQYGSSPAGIIEKGVPRLYTNTLLHEGDRVSVAQGGGVTFNYRVVAMVRAHRLMSKFLNVPIRYEFEIAEEPR